MRILVSDDHSLFLDGIRHILVQLEKDIDIHTSDSARSTIEAIKANPAFDLILLDLGMPGMGGLSVLDYIRQEALWIPVIIVSATEDVHRIRQAMTSGALGFIPKSHSGQKMLSAIRAVLNGEIYLPADIQQQLDRLSTQTNNTTRLNITQRQLDVLKLVAQGHANKKIAELLALTEHTVKAHLGAIFQALSVKNRTECVHAAQKMGLITVES